MKLGHVCFRPLTPKSLTDEIFSWLHQDDLREVIGSLKSVDSYNQQVDYISSANKAGHLWAIMSSHGKDIGLVKCRSLRVATYMFSLLIAQAEHRRKGYGKKAYEFCLHELSRAHKKVTIHAEVQVNNSPSIRFFEKLGFENAGVLYLDENPQILFKKDVHLTK